MFYDIYVDLCKIKGVSQSKAAESVGLSRTSVVKWKNGTVPSGATLNALAQFFDVSVDYLLGNTDSPALLDTKKDTPREVSEDDIKFALFDGDEEITDEMYEEVKRFAQFVKSKRATKNDDSNPV